MRTAQHTAQCSLNFNRPNHTISTVCSMTAIFGPPTFVAAALLRPAPRDTSSAHQTPRRILPAQGPGGPTWIVGEQRSREAQRQRTELALFHGTPQQPAPTDMESSTLAFCSQTFTLCCGAPGSSLRSSSPMQSGRAGRARRRRGSRIVTWRSRQNGTCPPRSRSRGGRAG